MIPVQVRVGEADVDVSSNEGRWRFRTANRTVLRPGKGGGRIIVGIGDRGDTTEAHGSRIVPAFDAFAFDPDISAAATRFWTWEAVQGGYRRSALRALLTRPTVHLMWPAWSDIPVEARGRYLRETAGFANVTVNGRPAAEWSGLRRLIGLPPEIFA